MKTHQWILISAFSFVLAACQGPGYSPPAPPPAIELGGPEAFEDLEDAEVARRCAAADFPSLEGFYAEEAPALLPWLAEWKSRAALRGSDEALMLDLRAGLQLLAARERFDELEGEVPGSGKAFLAGCSDRLDAFFTGRKIERQREAGQNCDASMSRLEQLCRRICLREIEELQSQQAELEKELAKPKESGPAERAAFQRQLALTRRLISRKKELEDLRVRLRVLEFSGEGMVVN